jgi:uncharacterized protein YjcR
MSDKHFNNKISLWIKQRLFISRKYDDTMTALEKFVDAMQTSDSIAILENEQQEQTQSSEIKSTDDEQRRFSLILPTLTGL